MRGPFGTTDCLKWASKSYSSKVVKLFPLSVFSFFNTEIELVPGCILTLVLYFSSAPQKLQDTIE